MIVFFYHQGKKSGTASGQYGGHICRYLSKQKSIIMLFNGPSPHTYFFTLCQAASFKIFHDCLATIFQMCTSSLFAQNTLRDSSSLSHVLMAVSDDYSGNNLCGCQKRGYFYDWRKTSQPLWISAKSLKNTILSHI